MATGCLSSMANNLLLCEENLGLVVKEVRL